MVHLGAVLRRLQPNLQTSWTKASAIPHTRSVPNVVARNGPREISFCGHVSARRRIGGDRESNTLDHIDPQEQPQARSLENQRSRPAVSPCQMEYLR